MCLPMGFLKKKFPYFHKLDIFFKLLVTFLIFAFFQTDIDQGTETDIGQDQGHIQGHGTDTDLEVGQGKESGQGTDTGVIGHGLVKKAIRKRRKVVQKNWPLNQLLDV